MGGVVNYLSVPQISTCVSLNCGPSSGRLVSTCFTLRRVSSRFFIPVRVVRVDLEGSVRRTLDGEFPFSRGGNGG